MKEKYPDFLKADLYSDLYLLSGGDILKFEQCKKIKLHRVLIFKLLKEKENFEAWYDFKQQTEKNK